MASHPRADPTFRVPGTLRVAGAKSFTSALQHALLACLLAQEDHWASVDVLFQPRGRSRTHRRRPAAGWLSGPARG